eukprot:jgi/Botrbrau1/6908/Bobra.67_3s0026.2
MCTRRLHFLSILKIWWAWLSAALIITGVGLHVSSRVPEGSSMLKASCKFAYCNSHRAALLTSKMAASGVWWLPGVPGTTPIIGGQSGDGREQAGPLCASRKPQPEYRENTLASLREAAASGARFVEFDVQVTADGVPVLWHDDWLLTKKEAGSPGHDSHKIAELTVEQFKAARQKGLVKRVRPPGDYKSEGSISDWAVLHDDGLPTLAEVFEGVPRDVGFDIEVKMAVPADVERTPPQEIERMVAPILETVLRYTESGPGASRNVAFTSFDPDVCVALRQRAPKTLPVLFLTLAFPYSTRTPAATHSRRLSPLPRNLGSMWSPSPPSPTMP